MKDAEFELLKNLCRSYISIHEVSLQQDEFTGVSLDKLKARVHSSIENLLDIDRLTDEEADKLRNILYHPKVYCTSYDAENLQSRKINEVGKELAEVIQEQVVE